MGYWTFRSNRGLATRIFSIRQPLQQTLRFGVCSLQLILSTRSWIVSRARRAAVGREFFRAENVVVQEGPTAGRPVKEEGHEGATEGQVFSRGDWDRAGVGEEDHREKVADERDAEVQGGGAEVETFLAAGALELEAAGRAGGVHLVELPGHEERLPSAVGAAVGKTPGEDVDAGDFHGVPRTRHGYWL